MTNKRGSSGWGGIVIDWKPYKNPTYTKTFYGTETECRYTGSLYVGYGWDVKLTEGEHWTMVATINSEINESTSEPITEESGSLESGSIQINWSIHYQTEQKEILQCDVKIFPNVGLISEEDKAVVENWIANPPKDGKVDYTLLGADMDSRLAALDVWRMSLAGTRNIPVSTPVLRMSAIIPSGYYFTANTQNINRYYSKTSLASAIGIPANFVAAMPQDTDPDNTYTNTVPYYYGWMKQPPSIDQNGTTMTINQDYVYGLYPQPIYGTRL